MILSYPGFMRTEWFNRDYEHPRLKDGAPKELKEQFENYYNDPKYENWPDYMRKKHPEIKNPYYTWDGKVVDLTKYAKK